MALVLMLHGALVRMPVVALLPQQLALQQRAAAGCLRARAGVEPSVPHTHS